MAPSRYCSATSRGLPRITLLNISWVTAFGPTLTSTTSLAGSGAVAAHLESLADWADGFAGRDPKAILRIMKDTRVGAFGVTAIALLLIGKYAAIFAVVSARSDFAVLVLAPVLARWTLTIIAATSTYPRPEGGTAKEFVGKGGAEVILQATVLMVIAVLLAAPLRGMIYLSLAAGAAWLFRQNSMKRVGGITGDILGADCEMVELVILMASSIISG